MPCSRRAVISFTLSPGFSEERIIGTTGRGCGGSAGGVLAGLWFRKIPAKALHLILGGVILAGGVRLIVC